MSKIYSLKKSFPLTTESVDEISGVVDDFCKTVNTDKRMALRYRLTIEEALLKWMAAETDPGEDPSAITLHLGKNIFSPYIRLSCKGNSLNPYDNVSDSDIAVDQDAFSEYSSNILVNLSLSPEYSYSRGCNNLNFKIKRKPLNPILSLLIVIAAAIAVSYLGILLLPHHTIDLTLKNVITPIYDTFFNILGCVAGPMIFLSVAWGIYGIGHTSTLSRIGKQMMLRFILGTLFIGAVGIIFFPILGPALKNTGTSLSQFSSISKMLLDIFPANIVQPFIDGNTLQVIALAFVVGIALLFLGRQTKAVAIAIEQLNYLVQFLMEFISKLVPYVVFLVVINMIWSNTFDVATEMWMLFLCMIAGMILTVCIFLFITSASQKVSPVLLLKKSIPTCLIALTTASSAASFGSNTYTCENKFGIRKSVTSFGVPLGMVMSKPATALYNVLVVFFFAAKYDVSASVSWIIIALLLCGIVAIATPPIPGGAAAAYTMIFSQLGIPPEALAMVLALDMLADFILTATDMFCLPMQLINLSSKLGTIDKNILRG